MKKFYLFLFLIASLFMMDKVSANTIYGIETTVDIDENGNGYVTEVWDMQANEGTESYHSFGNLEDRKITDFKVSMDDRQYTYVDSWNINASKSEKSYKNGINYTNGGLELCHGIEYGRHIYVINYIVENLVWQYNDTQIMYFSFLPQNMNPAPKVYNLTVFNKGNNEGIKYSSYGFKSKNSISNEGISFKSDGVLKSSDYVVALIGFPNGTFNSLKIVKNSGYDDVVSEALEGAKLNKSQTIWDLIGILIWPLIVLVMVVVAIVATIFEAKSKMRIDKTNYNIPKKVNNFRDIPFNKDFLLAYYIAREEGIFDKKNLIGAYLLKWIKEKKIEMVPTEGGFLDFNKNDNYYIDITNLDGFTEGVENSLCSFLRLASKDGKVTPKSFKKYCSKHYTEIENWLDRADGVSENRLVSEGYFTETSEEYNKKNYRKVRIYTKKLEEEVIKLKGLKQFLEDMSLIDEKKAIEVHVWDEYLIFAQAMGIADKVAKQFKDFHPEAYSQNEYYYSSVYWTSYFSTTSVSAAASARAAASSGGSFSGGGFSSGGFSSGGGGIR